MTNLLRNLFRQFINSQIKLSNWFDSLLAEKYRIDGYSDFSNVVLPKYIQKNLVIYDIGGGKNPYINKEMKSWFNCRVIGLDIDKIELNSAPIGSYDKIIFEDITKYNGDQDGDLAICIALLEHVKDVKAALAGIRSCLKTGGLCALFVPSGNAIFARINKILPENFKKQILFTLFPNAKECQGFPAYYDHCTPREVQKIAKSLGFEILDKRCYYVSSYFSFFFPLYLLWRIYMLVFQWIAKEQAAETFGLILKKVEQ